MGEVVALDNLSLDDVYSAEYTAHIEAIRREAALILSRIAMKHIFRDGPVTHAPDSPPPEPVAERQPFFFRKRLIEYLDDRGDLVRDRFSYSPTPALVKRSEQSNDDYFGGSRTSKTFEAMTCIEAISGDVLQGRDGLMLLEERFGAEATWRIWQYLMVDAPPKRACNSLVARALDLRLRSGRPTVVFEGGAGVGATLREALQIRGFGERINAIESYGFTDISRPLMRNARDTIHAAAPDMIPRMRFDRVDLDTLDEYDDLPYLQDAATDIIIFESVLHDVENLHRVLSSCRRILKPGGWLAFTIGSRRSPGLFFPCELLQSTLHSYYRAKIDPPRRVNVGYLSIDEWKASLAASGFDDFRIYPDVADHEKWPYGGIVARR